nr:golgin subfamily A member 6-like protein 2 isoform X2 [Pogona vitticeps]
MLQQIQEKEDLLAEALAEQDQIITRWQRRLQEMKDGASAREQELREQLQQRSQDARAQAQEMEQLRRRLAQAEAEVAQGAVTLEEHRRQLDVLKEVGDMKDRTLETFLREGEEKDRILQKLQELWLKRTRQGAGGKGLTLLPPTT